MRPKLLDLFCGAGGCAAGYHRAGYDVVGVDTESQPRYPFEFIKADAMMFLRCMMERHPEDNGGMSIDDFAAGHASPPCQGYSRMARTGAGRDAPRLIPELRRALARSGVPFVIENVEGAELEGWVVTLCGTMFGLRVRRHRLFEVSPPALMLTPACGCRNGVIRGRLIGHRVGGKVAPGRTKPPPATEADRRSAIGVGWMTTMEARQAVPPAFTEFIGRHLIAAGG